MSESTDNETSPELECPQCGMPLARINALDEDDAGRPRRVEFQCANGHHIVVERHETFEDRDAAV